MEENQLIFEFVFMSSTEVTVIEDVLLGCEIKSAHIHDCYITYQICCIIYAVSSTVKEK